MDFYTTISVIMDYGLICLQWFEVKNVLMVFFLQMCSFWLQHMLIDGLEWCELHVDYCDDFIRCLDFHSDGAQSLQRINCLASDVMLSPNLIKKQTHLHLRRPKVFIYLCNFLFFFFFFVELLTCSMLQLA